MVDEWDIAIVGGSVAGLSAALTLGRARRRVVVVDAGEPRNRFAEHMHGMLGHDGRPSRELVDRGRREVKRYGCELRDRVVVTAARVDEHFILTLDDGSAIHAKRMLVATGATDELPEIDGLAAQWGGGVVMCPYCHGYEVRDRRLGVVASGADGVQHAQLVRQWSDDLIYFSALGGPLSANDREGLEARGIELESRPISALIEERGEVNGVLLHDRTRVRCDAIFVDHASRPNDALLRALGADVGETPHGLAIRVDGAGATSVSGLWAAGNVVHPALTVPMAVSAGAVAGGAINLDLIQVELATALRARLTGSDAADS